MHILLSAEMGEQLLLEELRRSWPEDSHVVLGPGLLSTEIVWEPDSPPRLIFARQCLINATSQRASSVSSWSECLFEAIVTSLPENQPWMLHVEPHYGSEELGRNRCALIRESLRERLKRKRRNLLRSLQPEPQPFAAKHSLVQLILCGAEQGFLSITPAPQPWLFRTLQSPFPKGDVPLVTDKAAPSRAFTKLVEAESRMGQRIARDELCVDLGAAPGSWSYVALSRGAYVIAVDRAPLRQDLMQNRLMSFRRGDAFAFIPDRPVDWLLCDVIAAPERSIHLVHEWVCRRWARNFVVTIKFKGKADYELMDELKHALPSHCGNVFMTRLNANKNEACVFGTVARNPVSCVKMDG